MRIQNHNFMQGMNQTADQIQRAAQAEQALKQVRTESEIEVKMRKLRELLDANGKKVQNAVDPENPQKKFPQPPFNQGEGDKPKSKPEEEKNQAQDTPPKPSGTSRIDIRV